MKINCLANGFVKHAELMQKRIAERIPVEWTESAPMQITLSLDKNILCAESYEIRRNEKGFTIAASDELGLYYGIGKFLHTAKWTETDFTPAPPCGMKAPACDFRIMYFSVHAYNWYHMAPIEDLESYLEDMLLWGYNGIHCIIPVFNITKIGDSVFLDGIMRARRLFTLAKKVGLRVSLGINPNQGIKSSPKEFDADQTAIRWKAGRNLCASNPDAVEHLKQLWRAKFEKFTDIGIDYIITWPYDEGGCSCDKCWPWGAKKFCDLSLAVQEEARKYYPNIHMIASTWCFDVLHREGEGIGEEYAGIYARLNGGDMASFDHIMVDAHGEYPRYVLEHDAVKPIVNFPEISMWGLYPWGGFGANPLPRRFQRIWDSSRTVLSGGMPYSEGLYEDILKIQFAGYYWEPERSYRDILSEYVNYEYRSENAEPFLTLMELIEENHVAVAQGNEPDLAVAERAFKLANMLNDTLLDSVKGCWRWRFLYIRAILDWKRYSYYEARGIRGEKGNFLLKRRSGYLLKKDSEAQELLQELCRIDHCVPYNGENRWTHPPIDGGAPEDENTIFFDD